MTRSQLNKKTKAELIDIIIEMQENSFTWKGGRPRKKISEETIKKIKEMHNHGHGYRTIGEETGLSHTKVRQILIEML